MYGLDEYYNGLIEEAKSPEEIKKIYEYQFVQGNGVPQEVLDGVFEIDPTKKKSYTRWVLMQYGNYNREINVALSNGRLAEAFEYFKERANSGLDLTAIKSFTEAMDMLPDIDTVFKKEGDPNAPENDFEIVFKSPEWLIAVPHTYEADKKLGKGCKWCTAGAFGDNDRWWNNYSPNGPIWVNFDFRSREICPQDKKEYPYKRYQFLFEFSNCRGELKDCRDDDFFCKEGYIPDDVLEFYESQNERYLKILKNRFKDDDDSNFDDEEAYDRFLEERFNMAITAKEGPENDRLLILMPSYDSHDEMWNMQPNPQYFLYDEYNDSLDPLTFHEFDPDNFVVERFDGFNCFLGRDKNGQDHFYYYDSNSWDGRWIHGDCLAANIDGYPVTYKNNYIEVFFYNEETEYTLLDNQIKEIFSPNIDSYFLEDYKEGIWIEIIFETGGHGLLYSEYGNEIKTVVNNDVPINGKYFELKFDEQKDSAYVEGNIMRYYLSSDEETPIEKQLDSYYGDKYVVKQTAAGKVGQNIFDAENKNMMFNVPVDSIEEICRGVCIIRDKQKGEFLYCFDTDNVLTQSYKGIKSYEGKKGLFIGFHDKSVINVIVLDEKNIKVKVYGPFTGIVGEISPSGNLMQVQKGKTILILDLRTGEQQAIEGPGNISERFNKMMKKINNPYSGEIYD